MPYALGLYRASQATLPAHQKTPVLQGCASECETLHDSQVEDRGLERSTVTPAKKALSEPGGAESGAFGAQNAPVDVGLAKVIQAWPRLTAAMRARIQELIATR